MTNANEILEFSDLAESVIEVPEWGNKKILIKEMNGEQFAEMAKLIQKEKQFSPELMATVIISSSFDPETKQPIFQKIHKDALMQKSAKALLRVFTAIEQLSGNIDPAATLKN